MAAPRFVGSEVKRIEDPRLIRGQAQYVDDVTLPGLLYGHILRSPWAHARIAGVDVSEAVKAPAVFAILTGKDLEGNVKAKGIAISPPGL